MNKVSEAILALKPVTFRYKREIDPNRAPQFGLVAEQVEKVNRDLVTRDADGKTFTVRYDAVNAMLLNEFLKEHRKVEAQERKIREGSDHCRVEEGVAERRCATQGAGFKNPESKRATSTAKTTNKGRER